MADGWIIYAVLGVLVCLLLWQVAIQWKIESEEAKDVRAASYFWASLLPL
jgi:hypothetical protein